MNLFVFMIYNSEMKIVNSDFFPEIVFPKSFLTYRNDFFLPSPSLTISCKLPEGKYNWNLALTADMS